MFTMFYDMLGFTKLVSLKIFTKYFCMCKPGSKGHAQLSSYTRVIAAVVRLFPNSNYVLLDLTIIY